MLMFIRFITIRNTACRVLVQSVAAIEENPDSTTVPGVVMEHNTDPAKPERLDPCPVSEAAILDATDPVAAMDAAAELPPLPKLNVVRHAVLRIWFVGGGFLDVQGTPDDFMRKLAIVVQKSGGAHQKADLTVMKGGAPVPRRG